MLEFLLFFAFCTGDAGSVDGAQQDPIVQNSADLGLLGTSDGTDGTDPTLSGVQQDASASSNATNADSLTNTYVSTGAKLAKRIEKSVGGGGGMATAAAGSMLGAEAAGMAAGSMADAGMSGVAASDAASGGANAAAAAGGEASVMSSPHPHLSYVASDSLELPMDSGPNPPIEDPRQADYNDEVAVHAIAGGLDQRTASSCYTAWQGNQRYAGNTYLMAQDSTLQSTVMPTTSSGLRAIDPAHIQQIPASALNAGDTVFFHPVGISLAPQQNHIATVAGWSNELGDWIVSQGNRTGPVGLVPGSTMGQRITLVPLGSVISGGPTVMAPTYYRISPWSK